jgi:hypothetical protein
MSFPAIALHFYTIIDQPQSHDAPLRPSCGVTSQAEQLEGVQQHIGSNAGAGAGASRSQHSLAISFAADNRICPRG